MDTKFDELLEFPTNQTFKIMGVADDALPEQVISRLQQIVPGDYTPTIKPSSKGTYNSLSICVHVSSKEQMETIYTELSKLELVKVVL